MCDSSHAPGEPGSVADCDCLHGVKKPRQEGLDIVSTAIRTTSPGSVETNSLCALDEIEIEEIAPRTVRITRNGIPVNGMTDPAIIVNPYPFYERLRRISPIIRSEQMFSNAWVILDHDDVAALSRDNEFISNVKSRALIDRLPAGLRADFDPLLRVHSRWMTYEDMPEHSRLRGLLGSAFSQRNVDALRPFIENLATTLLSRATTDTSFDLMTYARGIPLLTIAYVMGFSDDLLPTFGQCMDDIATYLGAESPDIPVMSRAQVGLLKMEARFKEIVAERQSAPPRSDFLGHLLSATDQGRIWSQEELWAQCTLICFTGSYSTRNLIGNTLHSLLTHPSQLKLLQSDHSRIDNTVEEAARFDCPVQFIGKLTRKEFHYKGITIEDGGYAILMIGAANRDPGRYERADEFDIGRRSRHISYGEGAHACIGQGLARLEGQIAVSTFLRLMPNWTLDPELPPQWGSNPGLRGLVTLPVCAAG